LSNLAMVAALRMRGYLIYLQSKEATDEQKAFFAQDPVNALITGIRLVKLAGDRKKKVPLLIDGDSESSAAARPDSPPLNLSDWTVHGFFSQSGIRTTTPRRRRFVFEAPDASTLRKKRTADGIFYTDVERYGYVNGTEIETQMTRMELKI